MLSARDSPIVVWVALVAALLVAPVRAREERLRSRERARRGEHRRPVRDTAHACVCVWVGVCARAHARVRMRKRAFANASLHGRD